MIRRVLWICLVLSGVAIPTILISPGASAAIKSGTTCSKLSTTSIVEGYKFTCVKLGKKLVWNKGIKLSSNPAVSASPVAQPTTAPSPTPTSSPKSKTYFVQWNQCEEATGGHDGWVIGKNNTQSEFVFLRCTNSHNEDGSPTIVWQRPDEAAKIDQSTLMAIDGSGYIPPTYSNVVTHPDWYTFTETNHASAPTSFSNLFVNRRGIAYAAWSKMSEAVTKNASSTPIVEIFIGPNTKPYSNQGTKTITLIHKVLASNIGLKQVKVYYYNRQDQPWAANAIDTAIGASEVALAVKNLGGPLAPCYGTSDCNTSGAWTSADGIGYMYIGVPDSPNHRNLLSTVEPGEYFHAAWRYFYAKRNSLQSGPSPSIFPANQPPYWLNIGYEEIASDFSESNLDFKKYKSLMMSTSSYLSKTIPGFDGTWLNEYLNIRNLGSRWSDAHSGAPNDQAMIFGPKISEIFISLKGPSVILDLYDRMSQGQTFEYAFESEFGTPWAIASPEISKVLIDEVSSDY